MKFVNNIRLWLAYKLFPHESSFYTEGRAHNHYKNKNMEYVFLSVDNTQTPSFTKEEMIVTLDAFLGREITQEEWKTFLSWRNNELPLQSLSGLQERHTTSDQ